MTTKTIDSFDVLLAIRSTVCEGLSMLALALEHGGTIDRKHIAGDFSSRGRIVLDGAPTRYPSESASTLEAALCFAVAEAIKQHFACEGGGA